MIDALEAPGRAARIGASFRDPAGFVYRRDGRVLRQVTGAGAAGYDALMGSGLARTLVEQRLLIDHEEVDGALAADRESVHRVLAPEPVPFVSYPSEWSHAQLREAALTTLAVQRLALEHGLTLRDAPARNVQFVHGRAVHIDTTSFGRYREGEPWAAYRQFCEHFLAPLLVSATVDAGLARTAPGPDGIALELATRLVPRRRRVRHGLWLHVTAHAAFAARTGDASGVAAAGRGAVGRQALLGLVESLAATVRALAGPAPARSAWAHYDERAPYSAEALAAKRHAVAELLRRSAPATVWDLGANTGEFSALAVEGGAHVVAMEADGACVERCAAERMRPGVRLLPLVIDLLDPTPARGWANGETMTLAERGPADVVLALALVHHLALTAGVPLERVMALLAGYGRRCVVEWVPPEDPMAARLARMPRDRHPYTTDAFEAAVRRSFEVEERVSLPGSARTLLLLRSLRPA